MPAKIIRRESHLHTKRNIRRDLVETSKTGISDNDSVNEAIDEIRQEATKSGTGATAAIPKLAAKQDELEKSGQSRQRKAAYFK